MGHKNAFSIKSKKVMLEIDCFEKENCDNN